MFSEPLTFDKSRGLYSIAAVVFLAKQPGMIGRGTIAPTSESLEPIEMYVDTGSSISSITDSVATRLGLHIASLPVGRVGGMAGVTHQPVSPPLDLYLANRVAHLEKAVILTPWLEKAKVGKGVYKRTGEVTHPPINLIGLDAISALRARLVINPHLHQGALEFD